MLVESALIESTDLVGMNARVWRDALDADGAQPREEELRRRAHFHIGRERNGMMSFGGEADPINAAKLRSMPNAYTAPGSKPAFIEDPGGTASDTFKDQNFGDRAFDDQRTPGQRNPDIHGCIQRDKSLIRPLKYWEMDPNMTVHDRERTILPGQTGSASSLNWRANLLPWMRSPPDELDIAES